MALNYTLYHYDGSRNSVVITDMGGDGGVGTE